MFAFSQVEYLRALEYGRTKLFFFLFLFVFKNIIFFPIVIGSKDLSWVPKVVRWSISDSH